MHKHTDGKMFTQPRDDASTEAAASHPEATPGATPARQRVRRTVGPTEQRLRAANQQSWMTTRKGWGSLFRRFMPGGDR